MDSGAGHKAPDSASVPAFPPASFSWDTRDPSCPLVSEGQRFLDPKAIKSQAPRPACAGFVCTRPAPSPICLTPCGSGRQGHGLPLLRNGDGTPLNL